MSEEMENHLQDILRSKEEQNFMLRVLESDYGFEPDPSGWFVSEKFAGVGGIECYEWLTTRSRISHDFSRYEIGVHSDDLKGLLALARILNPEVHGTGKVLGFWNRNTKYTFKEADKWIFLGTDIEPTQEGLETYFAPVMTAYELAIKSAIENKTYDEMLKDKWLRHSIEHAENPSGRAVLFDRCFFDRLEKASCRHDDDPERIIAADTLKDFPLATYKTSLNFAPGTVVRNGAGKEFYDIWVIAYNGVPDVCIHASESDFNYTRNKWEHDNIRLTLPIPGDVQIKTFADLSQLTYAKLDEEIDNPEVSRKSSSEMDVAISVEDDTVEIKSKDNSFVFEIRKPECNGCGKPVWKFPYPQSPSVARCGAGPFFETNSSLGIMRFLVGSGKEKETYCADCIEGVVEAYLEDHPYAYEQLARETARRLLDSMGYKDVEIWNGQVWHMKNFWEFFTKIEYNRGGRKVRRHTGIPTLTDDGHFEPNMFSREYVEFRYKV